MSKNKPKQPLTGRQRKYFDFISKFIDKQGYSPSRQEIADEFETSIVNATRFIYALCDKGWVKQDSTKRPPILKVI